LSLSPEAVCRAVVFSQDEYEADMRVMIAAATAFSIFVATPAAAWPIVNLGGRGDIRKVGHKYKWEGGGCKYEYKADKKGVKEKYKCK
jgi:hypothetical protein